MWWHAGSRLGSCVVSCTSNQLSVVRPLASNVKHGSLPFSKAQPSSSRLNGRSSSQRTHLSMTFLTRLPSECQQFWKSCLPVESLWSTLRLSVLTFFGSGFLWLCTHQFWEFWRWKFWFRSSCEPISLWNLNKLLTVLTRFGGYCDAWPVSFRERYFSMDGIGLNLNWCTSVGAFVQTWCVQIKLLHPVCSLWLTYRLFNCSIPP